MASGRSVSRAEGCPAGWVSWPPEPLAEQADQRRHEDGQHQGRVGEHADTDDDAALRQLHER